MQTREDLVADGFHRKRTGLNHLCFNVSSCVDVAVFAKGFLAERGIVALYGGAREYPKYTPQYYAVFFEDPDRIRLEIAHY